MRIEMIPIGVIHSPYRQPKDVPWPSSMARADESELELFEEYVLGAADIRPGSMAYVLFYFDRSKGCDLTTLSKKTERMTGVFSTRSPRRPNGIGVTVVRFTGVEGGRLTFTGGDMLDDTPVLDIKPFDREILQQV